MRRTESGQVSIFVLGVALVCFAVAGIAVDGTRAFLYRRTLQNAADAAAIAGASEIDAGAYYSSRRDVVLERSRAGSSAMQWLAERGLAVEADVSATEAIVRVARTCRDHGSPGCRRRGRRTGASGSVITRD